MKYTPISEKEYNERLLLPAGEYAFEVLDAQPGVSKSSGADMIVLDLLIHAEDGSNRKVRSYLVASEGGRFQIRAFCKAVGVIAKYDAGTFNAEDCLGRSGWLKLKIEKGRAKEDGSTWPDKNSVASFIEAPTGKPRPAPVATQPPDTAPDSKQTENDEDAPF